MIIFKEGFKQVICLDSTVLSNRWVSLLPLNGAVSWDLTQNPLSSACHPPMHCTCCFATGDTLFGLPFQGGVGLLLPVMRHFHGDPMIVL